MKTTSVPIAQVGTRRSVCSVRTLNRPLTYSSLLPKPQELFADRPSYRRIELAVKAEAEASGEQDAEAMETEASAAVAAADAAEAEEEQGRNKRRRGGPPVDYAALNAKLEAEQAAAAAPPPPSSEI